LLQLYLRLTCQPYSLTDFFSKSPKTSFRKEKRLQVTVLQNDNRKRLGISRNRATGGKAIESFVCSFIG